MIIVLGSVRVAKDKVAEALAVSQEHVARSRSEPGCIEHGVSVDAESPNRLVFVERWASMDALEAHFAVPESLSFVRAVGAIAVSPPSMTIYQASEAAVGTKRAKPATAGPPHDPRPDK